MIKRRLKTCNSCHQERYLWGHGMCQPCAQKIKRAKLYIQPRSYKRIIEGAEYKTLCDEIDREAEETKQMECIFCGKEVKSPCDHHHLDGRSEHYLTKKYIKRAHGSCHRMYHDTSIHTWPWVDGFLLRIRGIDKMLYNRLAEKLMK